MLWWEEGERSWSRWGLALFIYGHFPEETIASTQWVNRNRKQRLGLLFAIQETSSLWMYTVCGSRKSTTCPISLPHGSTGTRNMKQTLKAGETRSHLAYHYRHHSQLGLCSSDLSGGLIRAPCLICLSSGGKLSMKLPLRKLPSASPSTVFLFGNKFYFYE